MRTLAALGLAGLAGYLVYLFASCCFTQAFTII
jgi:hypothetical protein